MLSSLFSPVKEPLVQRSSSRPAGQHQLGDCVWTRSPFALAEPEELSIITGWHSTGYFQVRPMCGQGWQLVVQLLVARQRLGVSFA